MTTTTPEAAEAVKWERENATRAGSAGIAAGLLTLVGLIIGGLAYKDAPHAYLVDAVRDAAGQSVPDGGMRSPYALFVHDHATIFVVNGVVLAIASFLVAPVLGFLYRATDARHERLSRFALYAGLIGPVLLGLGQLLLQIALVVNAGSFASDSDHSTINAHDVFSGGIVTVAQIFGVFGGLMLAAALAVIALNAMRAGLLTRFMGVLGIIVGVLALYQALVSGGLSSGQSTTIIQTFWFVAVGWLIIGRWPSGVPEAWATGEAKPWPSNQEIREQREAAKRAAAGEPEPAPAPAAAPHPSSKKKKRKRR